MLKMTVTNQVALTDPLAGFVGYQIRRCSGLMMIDLGGELAKIGLKSAEATILMVIDANPGCTQSDIGRLVNIKRANMVPLVASITEAGLVTRSRVDGRSQALELSEFGKVTMLKVRAAIESSEERLANGLSQRETARLIELLRKIRRRAGDDVGRD